jgi:hypothetical protein
MRGIALSSLAAAHVHSYSARLNDPQSARDRSRFRHFEKVLEALHHGLNCRPLAQVQDDYVRASFRWKSQDLAEIPVESDEYSPFSETDVELGLVGYAVKILVPNGHHIMAMGPQQLQPPATYVFVELQSHATRPIPTGTIRSRATSAP